MLSALELLQANLVGVGATSAAIERLETELSFVLPESYRQFMVTSNGCDGPIGELWIILYPIEKVASETAKHRLSTGLQEAVFIGTDGGGEAYILDTRQHPPKFGSIPFIGSAWEDLSFVASTLDEFVQLLSDA